jgi:hypothetical protein
MDGQSIPVIRMYRIIAQTQQQVHRIFDTQPASKKLGNKSWPTTRVIDYLLNQTDPEKEWVLHLRMISSYEFIWSMREQSWNSKKNWLAVIWRNPHGAQAYYMAAAV